MVQGPRPRSHRPAPHVQTGTGKTYTMEGTRNEDGSLRSDSDEAGIIVRAVARLFSALESSGAEHHVCTSLLPRLPARSHM